VRRVVGSGAVDDTALRQAVARAVGGGVGVARALLEAGAVEPELMRQAATDQIVDAVFDLLRWPNGDFSFGMGEENPDDVGLAVTTEQVVGDATSRRDAWESLSRLIPSPDVVLTMPVVLPEETSLDPDAWALLALIDGARSVGDIVDVSGAGQYTVVSTLAALIQRGLVVLRDEETPDHVALVRRRQQLLAPLEAGAAPAEPAAQPAAETEHVAPVGVPHGTAVVPGSTVPATAGGPSVPQAPAVPNPVPAGVPAAPAAAVASGAPGPLAGAHSPQGVVPPRPEPFLPKRDVDHPEPGAAPGFAAPSGTGPTGAPPAGPPPVGGLSSGGATPGGTAGVATAAAPAPEGAIERDPTVNRSLMLRLIAGVRGL